MKISSLLQALSLANFGLAAYTLADDYSGNAFSSMFNAFTGSDPTKGFVQYMGMDSGLITKKGSAFVLSTDSTSVLDPNGAGRKSMRLESKATYDSGLIIGDFQHMPASVCGTWPAFWTFGDNWPQQGEIDIIEGVNNQAQNAMTLHTGAGCNLGNAKFLGSIKATTCDASINGNAGCGIQATPGNNYGDGFNAAGGGVYATEWTSDHIAIWFFSRGQIPADITSGSPNPANWGTPQAMFAGACDIPTMFKKHKIVINTTFCGEWAGQSSVWGQQCAAQTGAATCNEYVAKNPGAFKNAYWEVNSLKVYQNKGGALNPIVPGIAGASGTSISGAGASSTASIASPPVPGFTLYPSSAGTAGTPPSAASAAAVPSPSQPAADSGSTSDYSSGSGGRQSGGRGRGRWAWKKFQG